MKANKQSKLFALQKANKGQEAECATCHKVREITVDHIIPVYLMEQLGLFDEVLNDDENFELVCYLCNRFKGGRVDMANPKTIPLLKKYIALLD